jgi:tRNA1(Val) A37 N6-methylase TrmN6
LSEDIRRSLARSEEAGTLKELISISESLLSDIGRLFLILPVSRHDEVICELKAAGLVTMRVQWVGGDKGKLFMIEAAKDGSTKVKVSS